MSVATTLLRTPSGARRVATHRAAALSGLAPREGLRLATRTALVRSLACYVALTTVLLLSLVAGRSPVPVGPEASGALGTGGETQALVETMVRHDCTSAGLGAGVLPAAAVVRGPGGHVRVVPIARAWAVHSGDAPGVLVAVCRSGPDRLDATRVSGRAGL